MSTIGVIWNGIKHISNVALWFQSHRTVYDSLSYMTGSITFTYLCCLHQVSILGHLVKCTFIVFQQLFRTGKCFYNTFLQYHDPGEEKHWIKIYIGIFILSSAANINLCVRFYYAMFMVDSCITQLLCHSNITINHIYFTFVLLKKPFSSFQKQYILCVELLPCGILFGLCEHEFQFSFIMF